MNYLGTYESLYHREPDGEVFCPYRISPLGAHIDHQYGKIHGLAIDKGIHIAYSAKKNGVIELCSLNFPKRAQFHIRSIEQEKVGDWADHLRGATLMLSEKHTLSVGMSAVIEGELPIGGLSSSAAVIIAFLVALCRVNHIQLEPMELILMAKAAENKYVGVNCGKLDQSCEVLCRENDLAADPEIDEFIVVTNHKFAEHFVRWGETKAQKITVVDDGTSTNETRLGAVKDIQFALEQAGVDDDVFVMAGDNVLDFSLCRFIEFAKARGTSCVMCHEQRELKKQQKTAIITIGRAPGEHATDGREKAEVRTSEADREDRMCGEDAEARASVADRGDPGAWGPADEDLITSYEEKPKVPKGHLAVPPFYFYRREDVKRIPEALAAGCGADAPGSFAAWLSRQAPMHAFVMPGKRYDVGDVESYRRVCEVFE